MIKSCAIVVSQGQNQPPIAYRVRCVRTQDDNQLSFTLDGASQKCVCVNLYHVIKRMKIIKSLYTHRNGDPFDLKKLIKF